MKEFSISLLDKDFRHPPQKRGEDHGVAMFRDGEVTATGAHGVLQGSLDGNLFMLVRAPQCMGFIDTKREPLSGLR